MSRRFRCPACRTRRTSFVLLLQHCADKHHGTCDCGGYHHPHRPGSPCCVANPMAAAHQALRAGATDDEVREIELDVVWHTPGKPFTEWR